MAMLMWLFNYKPIQIEAKQNSTFILQHYCFCRRLSREKRTSIVRHLRDLPQREQPAALQQADQTLRDCSAPRHPLDLLSL